MIAVNIPSFRIKGVSYEVTIPDKGNPVCGCRDWQINGNINCKHVKLARVLYETAPKV